MYDETKVTDNYGDYGGNDLWVEGKQHITGELIFEDGSKAPVANQAAGSDEDVNALLIKLKEGGIMVKDAYSGTVSAKKCPSTDAMPTAETKANSSHIKSVAISGDILTITLNCKVSDLAVADHGAWGKHKWIGFGITSGFESVVGLRFKDDTGATATLTADDAGEATTVGLSAGDFVLYIKTDDPKYMKGEKFFVLSKPGVANKKIIMKVVEDITLEEFIVAPDELESSDPENKYPNEDNIATVTLDATNETLICIKLKNGVTFNDLDNAAVETGDGPHKWCGALIETGVSGCKLASVNGIVVVPTEVAGTFRVYLPAEREQFRLTGTATTGLDSAAKLYFSADGYEDATYSIGVGLYSQF